jgi:predicted Zn-ribbon and HTH transcriptional regulator
MYSPRVLDELLPLQCEECGFGFSRTLGEYFSLGALRCPKCLSSIPLEDEDIHELARGIQALHSISDDLMGDS